MTVPGYAAKRPLAHRQCPGVSRGMSRGNGGCVRPGGNAGGLDEVAQAAGGRAPRQTRTWRHESA